MSREKLRIRLRQLWSWLLFLAWLAAPTLRVALDRFRF